MGDNVLLKDKSPLYKVCHYLFPLMSLTGFVLLWFLSANTEGSSMPTPLEAWQRMIEVFSAPVAKTPMVMHIWISFQRVFGSLIVAILVGVPFGIFLGWSDTFRGIFKPLFEIVRPIPAIAWVPLITLWFGVGEIPKMVIVFMGVVMPIVVNAYTGVIMIPQLNLDVAKIFGAKRHQILIDVVLPSSVGSIFAGIRTALSIGWMVLLAAEMISAQSGLGFLITRGSGNGDLALAIVAMLFIGIIGALFSYGFDYVERWLCPWQKK